MCNCQCNSVVEVAFYSDLGEDGKPIQDMAFANPGDACVDIRCKEDVTVPPESCKVIGTGLYVAIPDGYCMDVLPRSGISAKTDLIFKNTVGVIDQGFVAREICVMWYNLGLKPVKFLKGDRIAQARIEKVLPVKYTLVDSIETLKGMGNDRGGGLGSSGLK